MVLLLWLLIISAIVVLNKLIADKFESIANEKGHYGYFWWCFWLGIIGFLMVVALPDRNEKCNVENTNYKKSTNTSTNSGGFSLHAMAPKRETHQKNMTGKWSCKNCGTLNNNIDIQCKSCGKYR